MGRQFTKLLYLSINGTLNPLSIPGAWAVYSIQVTNTGRGIADAGTVAIGDMIDPNTSLFTGNFNGSGSPFVFIDGSGSNASGLSLDFGSLGDGSDGVTFLASGGGSMTPNGDFDPSVAGFSLQFDGAMNGASGTANPTFTIQYRVQVE